MQSGASIIATCPNVDKVSTETKGDLRIIIPDILFSSCIRRHFADADLRLFRANENVAKVVNIDLYPAETCLDLRRDLSFFGKHISNVAKDDLVRESVSCHSINISLEYNDLVV